MTKQEAQELVNSWNGEDRYFLHQGEIYTEDDVYEAESTTGRVFSINPATDVNAGYGSIPLTLASSVLFDADSPTGRYYIVEEAISYCVNTATGEMYRYNGCSWSFSS